MVSASLTEDRYGVVQKDLAEIMSALFNLQKVSFLFCHHANGCVDIIMALFRQSTNIKASQSLQGKTDSKPEISNLNKS